MKDFLLKAVSSGTGISSKRVIGGFILAPLSVACLFCIGFQYEIKPNVLTLAMTLIATGGGLLGLGVLESKTKKDDTKIIE